MPLPSGRGVIKVPGAHILNITEMQVALTWKMTIWSDCNFAQLSCEYLWLDWFIRIIITDKRFFIIRLWAHILFVKWVPTPYHRVLCWILQNKVSTTATDAPAPCFTMTSAVMLLTSQYKEVLVFDKEGFWLVSSQCLEMFRNANISSCFLKYIQHEKG